MLEYGSRATVGCDDDLQRLVVPAVERVAEIAGPDSLFTCDRGSVIEAHDIDRFLQRLDIGSVPWMQGKELLSILGQCQHNKQSLWRPTKTYNGPAVTIVCRQDARPVLFLEAQVEDRLVRCFELRVRDHVISIQERQAEQMSSS